MKFCCPDEIYPLPFGRSQYITFYVHDNRERERKGLIMNSINSERQGNMIISKSQKKVGGMRVKTHIRAGDGGGPGGSGGDGDPVPNHNETMLSLPRKGMRVKTHIRAGDGGGTSGGSGGDGDPVPNHNETML